MKKQIEEEDEEDLEEFEEDEDLEDEEEKPQKVIQRTPPPMPVKKTSPKEIREAVEKEIETPKEKAPEVIAVPRVVSIEAMLNEIYDRQQEIIQALTLILERRLK